MFRQKINLLAFLCFLVSSSQSFAEDFEYQKNLIACQHNFSSCDASLLKSEHSRDVNLAKIELAKQLKEKAAVAEVNKSSQQNTSSTKSNIQKSLPSTSTRCVENGSCYGDISTATGRSKTVSVKGYYRKDGTYVRGHYRSKPTKR